MATKEVMQIALDTLRYENMRLLKENEEMRAALCRIYTEAYRASGIEAAVEAREAERLKATP